MNLVGNHHRLDAGERDILHRGVFGKNRIERRKKKISVFRLSRSPLSIDGHNVLITLESALKGLPLVAADDGFIRDISRSGRRYAPGPYTDRALALIFNVLVRHRPPEILVLFDSPISKSGELAAHVRNILLEYKLKGSSEAVPVPETLLGSSGGTVASSDTAVIDSAAKVFDLAGYIIRRQTGLKGLIRLR